jgi:hypothetical protein
VTGSLPTFPPESVKDYPGGVKYHAAAEWYYIEGHVDSCAWMGPAVHGTLIIACETMACFVGLSVVDMFRRSGFATSAILEAAAQWPTLFWESTKPALPFSEALVSRGIARNLGGRMYCASSADQNFIGSAKQHFGGKLAAPILSTRAGL